MTAPRDPADLDLGGPVPQMPPILRATADVDPAAERWTRAPRDGDEVVLLLHGLGSHEDDLAALAPHLPSAYVYVSLRGIWSYGPGWAWLDAPVEPGDRSKLMASAEALERWIDGLGHGSVVGAIGFSQGAILALELLRRRPGALAWVAPLSGAPFPAPLPGDAELARRRPPAFWGHGGRDPLFTPDMDGRIRSWLAEHTELVEELSPALDHGIDDRVLAALAAFVAQRRTS